MPRVAFSFIFFPPKLHNTSSLPEVATCRIFIPSIVFVFTLQMTEMPLTFFSLHFLFSLGVRHVLPSAQTDYFLQMTFGCFLCSTTKFSKTRFLHATCRKFIPLCSLSFPFSLQLSFSKHATCRLHIQNFPSKTSVARCRFFIRVCSLCHLQQGLLSFIPVFPPMHIVTEHQEFKFQIQISDDSPFSLGVPSSRLPHFFRLPSVLRDFSSGRFTRHEGFCDFVGVYVFFGTPFSHYFRLGFLPVVFPVSSVSHRFYLHFSSGRTTRHESFCDFVGLYVFFGSPLSHYFRFGFLPVVFPVSSVSHRCSEISPLVGIGPFISFCVVLDSQLLSLLLLN